MSSEQIKIKFNLNDIKTLLECCNYKSDYLDVDNNLPDIDGFKSNTRTERDNLKYYLKGYLDCAESMGANKSDQLFLPLSQPQRAVLAGLCQEMSDYEDDNFMRIHDLIIY